MATYFNKLIQSYGTPTPSPGLQMPWMTDDSTEPAPDQAGPVVDVAPPIEYKPPDQAPAQREANFEPPVTRAPPSLEFDPTTFEKDIADPAPEAPTPVHIERLTERIIERHADQTASLPDVPAPSPEAPSPITQLFQTDETTVHVHETQIDGITPASEPADLPDTAAAPVDPPMPAEPPAAIAGDSATHQAMLEEVDTRLANAFAKLQTPQNTPPLQIIDIADFEPDATPHIPQAETETVREVTREIVKEIHHHHETQVAPPQAKAPKSASEASQIGKIRFASGWDRMGDM